MAALAKICDQVDIHSLPDLSLQVYWVLDKLSVPGNDRFTSTKVAKYLVEDLGIATYPQLVVHALNKSKKACNRNKVGYKLMKDGLDALREHSSQNGVVFIDANKPFSAKSFALKKILGDGYKELSICDPYVDLNTLDVIFRNFPKKVPIRLLTSNVIDKPTGAMKRQLKDFQAEGFNLEIRVYGSSTLHDRYIISEKHFWYSGNSLNYLGAKESFLILLGEDTRQSMLSMFNSRWNGSTVF